MSEAERNQIEFEAFRKWTELKESIKDKCERLHFAFQDDGNEIVAKRIRADGLVVKRLRVEFEPVFPRLSWSCSPSGSGGDILLRVENGATFFVAGNQLRMDNEVLAVLISCLAG